jgi:uncharacterized membrane protein YeaQ/YmgE (transglycosylase-associated protein family)
MGSRRAEDTVQPLAGTVVAPAGRRFFEESVMSVGTWVVAGLVVGFLASKLVIRSGDGLLRDIGLGVVGAVLSGGIFGAVSTPDATNFNVFGLVVTLAGAGAALVVYHTLFPRVRPG